MTIKKLNKESFCGHVALAGVTNAGKSSLLNALAEEKISIISSKPQTTRTVVYGVVTQDMYQAVLVDTPGAFGTSAVTMRNLIRQQMFQGLYEGQIILLVIDAIDPSIKHLDQFFEFIATQKVPVLVAINKVDLLKRKDDIFPLTEKIINGGKNAGVEIEDVIAVSAMNGNNINLLRDKLLDKLPAAPFAYDPKVSNINKNEFISSELLREQVFLQLHKEIPFGASVVCDSLEDKLSESRRRPGMRFQGEQNPEYKFIPKKIRFIKLTLQVRKEQHRAIVLGARGSKIKLIASRTRLGLEEVFAMKVMLTVRVTVFKPTVANLTKKESTPL
ncbi:MAG: GTPase Era [Candidatus Portiera sp.]|nr:GTPase Era [Portiera sp.]